MFAALPVILVLSCGGGGGFRTDDGRPAVDGVTLSPDPASELDTLTCAWQELRNASEVEIAWYLDDARVKGASGTTMTGEFFDKGDKVACEVTPVADGAHAVRSNTVRIQNAPPQLDGVAISPEDPDERTLLYAEVEAWDPDPADADRLVVHYRWFVNGEAAGIDEHVLGQAWWEKGDSVVLRVQVEDRNDTSPEVASDAVVIGNAPPGDPVVQIVQTGPAELTCELAEEAQDPDSMDTVTYSVSWREFGLAMDQLDDQWVAGESEVRPGGAYTCTVTASDGEDVGGSDTASYTLGGAVYRYRWVFPSSAARAGHTLAALEDLDGDGAAELVAGMPGGSLYGVEGGGAVLLDSRSLGARSEVDPYGYAVSVSMDDDLVHAGLGLGTVPDLDGDGHSEIALGVPGYYTAARSPGLAAVVPSGFYRDGGDLVLGLLMEDTGYAWLMGNNDGEDVGNAVAGMDLDGDGLGEMIVGAPHAGDTGEGRVAFLDGEALAGGGSMVYDQYLMEARGDGGSFGYSLLVLDDFAGEGGDELLVGAPDKDAGVVYLFDTGTFEPWTGDEPGPMAEVKDAWATATGEQAGDAFGGTLAPLDGWSQDDVVMVGAHGAGGGAGAIYFWTISEGDASAAAMPRIAGSGSATIGVSMADLGDVDGDGYPEIAVGAPEDDTTFSGAGAVYVVGFDQVGAAGTGGLVVPDDAKWAVYGEDEGDAFGTSVLGPGDLDGDGRPDLVVGAPQLDDGEQVIMGGGLFVWVGIPDL